MAEGEGGGRTGGEVLQYYIVFQLYSVNGCPDRKPTTGLVSSKVWVICFVNTVTNVRQKNLTAQTDKYGRKGIKAPSPYL